MFCKKCEQFYFTGLIPDGSPTPEHACVLFNIVDEDGEDHELYAWGFSEAAEAFAQKTNELNEHYLMDNEVTIKVSSDGITKEFAISAEPEVSYRATEVTND